MINHCSLKNNPVILIVKLSMKWTVELWYSYACRALLRRRSAV